jgi:hypothetical protein
MGIKTILINGTHCSNLTGNKNQFRYDFVGGGLDISDPTKKYSIGVSSLTIPYSFFNVSDIYLNKKFSIIVPTSVGSTTTYNIELPSSFMTVDDINKYLQFWAINNNFYTVNSVGDYTYYIELEYNISTYSVNCIFYPLALPSGGTNPAGMYLDATGTMQLVISTADAGFGKLIGLSPNTYPATNASSITVTVNSNITVSGSEINALNLCCSIVRNDISNTVDSFYAFTPSNSSFGSNISLVAPEIIWVDCFKGRYQNLTITIRDQNNREIQCRDANVCVMLCLKEE